MTLAFQRIPDVDIPRGEVRHDTSLHSLPQPRQELSTKCATCLGYRSKNVEPFDIFARKEVGTPDLAQAGNFVAEVDHREVREDLQEGFVWKFEDFLHTLARAPRHVKQIRGNSLALVWAISGRGASTTGAISVSRTFLFETRRRDIGKEIRWWIWWVTNVGCRMGSRVHMRVRMMGVSHYRICPCRTACLASAQAQTLKFQE